MLSQKYKAGEMEYLFSRQRAPETHLALKWAQENGSEHKNQEEI